jgi:hypothetical protein
MTRNAATRPLEPCILLPSSRTIAPAPARRIARRARPIAAAAFTPALATAALTATTFGFILNHNVSFLWYLRESRDCPLAITGRFGKSCSGFKSALEGYSVAKTCRLWLPLPDYAAKHGRTWLPRRRSPAKFQRRPLRFALWH